MMEWFEKDSRICGYAALDSTVRELASKYGVDAIFRNKRLDQDAEYVIKVWAYLPVMHAYAITVAQKIDEIDV